MEISFAQAISDAIKEEMIKDDKITFIGEDIGIYGGIFKSTKGL